MKTQNIKTGVTQANKLNWTIFDEIDRGIDITLEGFINDLKAQGKSGDEIQRELDHTDFDSRVVLFGDWTKKNGKYEPDKSKDFAAVYNSDTNIICVEWSKTLKTCRETSPCYVMSDGSGRCGDLDSEGDSVTAYSLPEEYFKQD